jgi:hypothetical protein
MKKYLYLISVNLALILLLGCAAKGGYGKLRIQYGRVDKVTIDQLAEQWRDYDIYYAGVRIPSVSAIVFDPKGDDRKLTYHEWWEPVKSSEDLHDLIGGLRVAEFIPELWQIRGPDNQIYGYMFTAWSHAYIKVIDGKTMWIDDMTLPPTAEGESFNRE